MHSFLVAFGFIAMLLTPCVFATFVSGIAIEKSA